MAIDTTKTVTRIPPEFRRALDLNPHCRTLRLAIVDALLEAGDTVGAEGMRALVDRLEIAPGMSSWFVVQVSRFFQADLGVDWWHHVPGRSPGVPSDTFDRLLFGWCQLTDDERETIKERTQ